MLVFSLNTKRKDIHYKAYINYSKIGLGVEYDRERQKKPKPCEVCSGASSIAVFSVIFAKPALVINGLKKPGVHDTVHRGSAVDGQ